jgi:hypothetical protein
VPAAANASLPSRSAPLRSGLWPGPPPERRNRATALCAAPERVLVATGRQPVTYWCSPGMVSVPPNWPAWTTFTLVK